MTEQPEALRLADALIHRHGAESFEGAAAAELRRLHAQRAALLEELRMWLHLHEAPAGYEGKYGKALDAAIAAQQVKIDAAANAARAAIKAVEEGK